MLSIGELSRITRLTVKTLRFYHEKGLLIPDRVDVGSRYRYYRSDAVERAETIVRLKEMGFSISEMQHILAVCREDLEVVDFVRDKMAEIDGKIRRLEETKRNLAVFMETAQKDDKRSPGIVEMESVPGVLTASIRYKGRYSDIGARFRTLFKTCGRYVAGSPFAVYYDGEYVETAADIEACVPVSREVSADGVSCRFLEGGEAVTLIHKGPYQELGKSYRVLFEYCRQHDIQSVIPNREYYLKGPGMIWKGNPASYRTKLALII
jgi:DNA-binding transcriptional MerR regulator